MKPVEQESRFYVGNELELFARADNWKKYFGKQLKPFLRGNVLEVGAGLGVTTRFLCRSDVIGEWVCLEPDPDMAAGIQAEIDAGSLPPCCRLINETAQALLVAGHKGTYDCVLYIDVLEHIVEDENELQCARQLLKPGGFLIVLSPAFQWLFTPFDTSVGHIRRYNRRGLTAIEPVGMRRVMCRYLDSVGLLTSLANLLVLNSEMPTVRQVLTWDRLLVPLSRVVDVLTGFLFGRSILAIWRKE